MSEGTTSGATLPGVAVTTTPVTPGPSSMRDAADAMGHEVTTIPVVAERVIVTKELVEVARTVLTKTVTDEPQTLDTLLTHDEVVVERVPVNVYVDAPPPVRVEGDTTIIPVLREVAVVVTRILVVEEVRVTKRTAQHVDHQVIPARVEHVQVERIATPPHPESRKP